MVLIFLNSFLAFALSFVNSTFSPMIKYLGIIVNMLYIPIKKCLIIDIIILGIDIKPVIKNLNNLLSILIVTPPRII